MHKDPNAQKNEKGSLGKKCLCKLLLSRSINFMATTKESLDHLGRN